MRIIKDIKEIENLKMENTAIALGKFDGVHRGHRRILERLTENKTNGYTSLVFTFSANPIDGGESLTKRLFTEKEQLLVYEKLGIDTVIIYPVGSGILQMSPEEFVRVILAERLGVKKIICGENFRFGKDREGDVQTLRELEALYGYKTEVVPLLTMEGNVISSTIIKKHIESGDMEGAERLMGHKYRIVGRVVHGNEIGRTLDTPTANLIPEEDKLLPPNGVYISSCIIDGRLYKGVTNIGYKPTIEEGVKRLGVETHFLDYEGDLYGRILEIEIERFTRGERKFEGIRELKRQLEEDKNECRKNFWLTIGK